MASVPSDPIPYNHDLLVHVLTYHGRTRIEGCHCGWVKLGASHPEHVADTYEGLARAILPS